MGMGALELGRLIRQARLRKGWQQQDVAARLNVDAAYISAIEGGKRNWPQQYITPLAETLGIDQVEMAIAAGLIERPKDRPEPPADDPRELLINRIRALPWDSTRQTLESLVTLLEQGHPIPREP